MTVIAKKYFTFTILVLTLIIFPRILTANFSLAEKAYQNKIYNFAIINYIKALDGEKDQKIIETSLYRLINSYYQVGQYSKAIKRIEEYQTRFSESIKNNNDRWGFEIKYIRTLISFAQKKYLDTKKFVNELIETYPKHPEVGKLFLMLAQVLNQEGDRQAALEVLDRSINGYEADRGFLKAKINYNNKNDQIALAEINQIKKTDLKIFLFEEAVDLQVEILLRLKNYDDAVKVMNENFYRLQVKNYQDKFRFYQSHIFFLQKNYPKAIVAYKDYLAKTDGSPFTNDAIFFLALSFYQSKQPIIALEYINKLEQHETKNPETFSVKDKTRKDKLAYFIYQKLNRQNRQQVYLDQLYFIGSPEELFAVKEKIKWVAVNKSTENKISKQLNDYLIRYEKIEQDLKAQATFYNEVSQIYFQNSNLLMGKIFSERAFNSSSDSTYLLSLADRLASSKDFAKANQVYETLLTKVTGYQKHYVYDAWGYSLFQEAKYEQSIKAYSFNTNVEEKEFKASAIFYIGENNRLLQQYQKAKVFFGQFLDNFPQDERVAIAYLNLGFIQFYGDKDYRGALQSLNRAYEKIKDNQKNLVDNSFTSAIDKNTFLNNIIEIRFRSYLKLDDEEKAQKELNTINKRNFPDIYFNNLFLMGKFFFNKGDYSKALNSYYGIINADNSDTKPNDEVLEKAYFERIVIKLKEESGREAYFYLQKFKERFHESVLIDEGYLSVGDYYFTAKRWVSAETIYSELAKNSNKSKIQMYSLYYLGFVQQQLDKKSEAYQQFKAVKEIGKSKKLFNSFYYDALFELGLYEFDNTRYSESQSNFEEIVKNSQDKNLITKAQKNLNIMEGINDPNPYKGLKKISDIRKKIDTLASPNLKEQGHLLIGENYYSARNYKEVFNALKPIKDSSPYFHDSVVLNLRAFLAIKEYERAFQYGIEKYFMEGFNISGKNREFFYYALAFSAKKLSLKDDYKRFFSLLKKEFPDTEYLNN